MNPARRIANILLALILALPLALALRDVGGEDWVVADLIPPTGEAAALIMFAAMAIGPLGRLAGQRRPWVVWLMRQRRRIGVTAFAYAALHLALYLVDTGTLHFLLAEIGAPGIWTGWLAFLLMLPPALASNDAAMRLLRRRWKMVQRLIYPVVILTIIHGALLMYDWVAPLVHVAPMLLLYLAGALIDTNDTLNKRTIA